MQISINNIVKRKNVIILTIRETNNNLFTTLSKNKISRNQIINTIRKKHKILFFNKKQKEKQKKHKEYSKKTNTKHNFKIILNDDIQELITRKTILNNNIQKIILKKKEKNEFIRSKFYKSILIYNKLKIDYNKIIYKTKNLNLNTFKQHILENNFIKSCKTEIKKKYFSFREKKINKKYLNKKFKLIFIKENFYWKSYITIRNKNNLKRNSNLFFRNFFKLFIYRKFKLFQGKRYLLNLFQILIKKKRKEKKKKIIRLLVKY